MGVQFLLFPESQFISAQHHSRTVKLQMAGAVILSARRQLQMVVILQIVLQNLVMELAKDLAKDLVELFIFKVIIFYPIIFMELLIELIKVEFYMQNVWMLIHLNLLRCFMEYVNSMKLIKVLPFISRTLTLT